MSSNPNPRPISTASFRSDVFSYDPLYASETISRSGTLTGFPANSLVARGTVLFGSAPGVPQTGPYSYSGSDARAILAADVTMPAAGNANCLVYIQGKFLESGMTFSAAGAASDAASLWTFGIYVLDVMDRTGLMVPLPLDNLVQQEGPPQMDEESRKKAIAAEIAAIRAAGPQPPPTRADAAPRYRHHPEGPPMPAWATVAFEDAVQEEPVETRPLDPSHPGYRPPQPPLTRDPHDPDPKHVDQGHAVKGQTEKHPGAHDASKHSDHEPKHVDQPKDSKK
jgi:hypothetical protein